MTDQLTMYLCEKPSQARCLADVLGARTKVDGAYVSENVVVTYGFGHLLSIPLPGLNWNAQELPYLPTKWSMVPKASSKAQLETIGVWLKKATHVIIATDPDEEGEVIGREILSWHRYSGRTSRLWVSALDPDSIRKALGNLRQLRFTDHIYQAGRTRHLMDWLFGINLTRLFSLKFGQTARIGRVKTALLNEIAQQEQSVLSYKPQYFPYSEVSIGGQTFSWSGDVGSDQPSFPNEGVCTSITDELTSVPPPLPLTLTSLLIEGSLNGVGIKDGADAAQKLYLKGAITYPRTSSTLLPGAQTGFAAHHAILPTNPHWTCPDSMGAHAQMVYGLVRLNWVLQQIGAAEIFKRVTTVNIGGFNFTSESLWVETDRQSGWMVCVQDEFKKLQIGRPALAANVDDRIRVSPVSSMRRLPGPEFFNEASLLSMMARSGLGTESTRVNAIHELLCDGVVSYEKHFLLTQRGLNLVRALPNELKNGQMEAFVRSAVDKARKGVGQEVINLELLNATKWLMQFLTI